MPTLHTSGVKPVTAGTNLARGTRVVLDANDVPTVAGLADRETGTLKEDVQAGEVVGVTVDGVGYAIASKAIADNAIVYSAADGKVSDVQATGARRVGRAMSAAGADGDEISIVYQPGEVAGS